jgi:nitrogen regulatory protein PII
MTVEFCLREENNMHFKLIMIVVEDKRTAQILDAARDAGATGCTVLNQARGEGITPSKTFLGLSIDSQVDVIMLLAEEHMSREILEMVAAAGEFDETPGSGIAFQIDVEDAIGVRHQIAALTEVVEDRL